MFGVWGGMFLQVAVTIAVILVLIGVVYWLVRRYSAGGIGRLARGRVPRLAVIDAMAVDGRRRLVLVRRDNVEHLILIGGPSDIVVEQAIQRTRQRLAPKSPAAVAPGVSAFDTPMPPEAPAAVSENPPIPFPQVRVHQPAPQATGIQPAAPPPSERVFQPFRRSAPAFPPAATAAAPASTAVRFEPMADVPPVPAESPPNDILSAQPARAPFPRHSETGNGQTPPDVADARPTPAPPASMTLPAEGAEDTAVKVNDLEREMARLLGEITARRPS